MYKKLKRTWSHNSLNYIPRFREVFPELRGLDSEDLADRFIDLGLDFYTEEEETVSLMIRFTVPFALILMLLMLILLPVNFLFSGKWGYGTSRKLDLFVHNWFRSLRLI